MPSRRLEDRVRELCAKATAAEESEIVGILTELRETLAEHNRRLRKMAAQKLAGQEKNQNHNKRSE
ncbi:MAG TPA: hypothetical protein VFA67_06835 [Candidatus Sulfotelmatobacter sp.]|nr:hypothetical protein [Candidatus Sulfotelmatobacter sp.]